MAGYLDVVGFTARTVMPSKEVEALEKAAPGWLLQQSESLSRVEIDARLRKRYAAPFDVATCPEAVKVWLTRLLTFNAYLRLGVDPNDQQWSIIHEQATDTQLQIKEAANSVDGLYDLPLRDSEKTTGIVKGAPRGYSEPGPYQWLDAQREELGR